MMTHEIACGPGEEGFPGTEVSQYVMDTLASAEENKRTDRTVQWPAFPAPVMGVEHHEDGALQSDHGMSLYVVVLGCVSLRGLFPKTEVLKGVDTQISIFMLL